MQCLLIKLLAFSLLFKLCQHGVKGCVREVYCVMVSMNCTVFSISQMSGLRLFNKIPTCPQQ